MTGGNHPKRGVKNGRSFMTQRNAITVLAFCMLPALVIAQSGGGTSDLRVSGKFISDVPTGDPPLQVNSTTNVPNLNADKLDGFDVGDFATAGSGAGVHYKNLVGIPGGDIDQTCATAGGCFAGDAGGFPVTISDPGSYRLISNLETTDPNQTLIEVDTGEVLLDLNGFALIGPTSCSGTPASCTSTGTGRGVDSDFFDITVRNGEVTGMGANGIELRDGAVVENVRATSNGADGIQVESDSRVVDNVIRSNGVDGIHAGNGSVITDNVSVSNGADGVATVGSRVVGNTTSRNAQEGIECTGACVVRANRALDNGDIGLRVIGASVIKDNVVQDNVGDGIVNTLASGTILDNTVTGNDTGLQLRGTSGYARNIVKGNNTNVVNGTELGVNVCGADTTCP